MAASSFTSSPLFLLDCLLPSLPSVLLREPVHCSARSDPEGGALGGAHADENGLSGVVPGTASAGPLSETRISRSHPRPTESEILGWRLAIQVNLMLAHCDSPWGRGHKKDRGPGRQDVQVSQAFAPLAPSCLPCLISSPPHCPL